MLESNCGIFSWCLGSWRISWCGKRFYIFGVSVLSISGVGVSGDFVIFLGRFCGFE